jgi:uncharacterized membrane protein
LERWEIVGPRGFAIAGGAVTALGVVLLFVLAANRGWIGPAERVALGAVASALVFGVGLALHARYGQYAAALGAVGAGIAGAYATLAAATALYDLVPDALALPLAALIAAVAVAVSLRWSSEIVAGLGLVGSALAPALESIDTGLTASSAAFAVIVLAATGAVAVPRGWQRLLGVVAAVVGVQVAALVLADDAAGDPATIAVAASLALVVLAIGCALQWRSGHRELGRLALSLLLADVGFALLAGFVLFDGRERGLALAVAAAVVAAVWASLRRHQPDLGLVLGVSALAVGAVATGDLLVSDEALTLAWAAQAALLTTLAARLQDARLAAMGYGYLIAAAANALGFAAPPSLLFDAAETDALAAAAPAATAVAAVVAGVSLGTAYRSSGEEGVLAWMSVVRAWLLRVRATLQEALLFSAGALGVYAVSVLLVDVAFEAGHVAASGVAAAAGVAAVAVAAWRRSTWLVVAGFTSLALVLGEALAFDIDEFLVDDRSTGGWSVLEAAAGLFLGGAALRVLHPSTRRLGIVSGIAGSLALLAANVGVLLVVPQDEGGGTDHVLLGLAFALVAATYLSAAAAVFRVQRLRNLSTTLWTLGLLALLEAEAAFADDLELTLAAYAATAAAVAVVGRATGEQRLWLASSALGSAATLCTLVAVTSPDRFVEASSSPAADIWVLAACIGALVVVAATAPAYRLAAAGVTAGVTLYGASLAILELAERISGASVQTDFERGHTAVSAAWALLGLGLLVVGLLRGAGWLRIGGLALFGVSLAKIFVYDLSELSSLARALSFLAVGGLLLAAGFFVQRLSERLGPGRGAST